LCAARVELMNLPGAIRRGQLPRGRGSLSSRRGTVIIITSYCAAAAATG